MNNVSESNWTFKLSQDGAEPIVTTQFVNPGDMQQIEAMRIAVALEDAYQNALVAMHRERIAASGEGVCDDDPQALKDRIIELEEQLDRELAARGTGPEAEAA